MVKDFEEVSGNGLTGPSFVVILRVFPYPRIFQFWNAIFRILKTNFFQRSKQL
jgi:hypothetical protein